jgi:hypothetical protein
MPSSTPTSFNPLEFYTLASWLFMTKPTSSAESLKRTIIGRAYYAALLSGSDKTGIPTDGPNGHQNVIQAVRRIDSLAGNNLSSIGKLRRAADYEKNHINERDVQISLRDSRKVLEILGFIKPTDPTCTVDYLDKEKFFVQCVATAPTSVK